MPLSPESKATTRTPPSAAPCPISCLTPQRDASTWPPLTSGSNTPGRLSHTVTVSPGCTESRLPRCGFKSSMIWRFSTLYCPMYCEQACSVASQTEPRRPLRRWNVPRPSIRAALTTTEPARCHALPCDTTITFRHHHRTSTTTTTIITAPTAPTTSSLTCTTTSPIVCPGRRTTLVVGEKVCFLRLPLLSSPALSTPLKPATPSPCRDGLASDAALSDVARSPAG